MSALGRKLTRDLVELRGPVFTIALVVACGIAAFVTMSGTFSSLLRARDAYYSRYRFGEVFARAERVPSAVRAQLVEAPGLAQVYTRVVGMARAPMPGMDTPAMGYVISLPEQGEPPLNGVRLVEGRAIAPGRTDEVLLLESFARAHDLRPGARISLVIEGTMRTFRAVGFATSPEFVFALPPGENLAPDDRRFLVAFLPLAVAAPAYDLDGAFNDVVATMQPGASEPAVLAELDHILEPYGGTGAFGRDRQPSHYFLSQELAQIESLAVVAPILFLSVAAFLLNVVLSRVVQLQRQEIATLKALGYSDRAVGRYYAGLVTAIVLIGATVGLVLGSGLGRAMTGLYKTFFRLPDLEFRMTASLALAAVLSSLASGLGGALFSVRSVVRLPPAEAMRPPAPAVYRAFRPGGLPARIGRALFGPSIRMMLRELARRPARLVLSVIGVALAVGILLMGRSFVDAMDYLVDDYLAGTQREDITVTFVTPRPPRAVRALSAVPGVLHAEGLRALPINLRAGHHERQVVAFGYPPGLRLRVLKDSAGRLVELPRSGALLTRTLAEILGVGPGDEVSFEPLEGDRRVRSVRIAGLVDEMFGIQIHMRSDALHLLLGETETMSTALLSVDRERMDDVLARLRDFPQILGAGRRDATIAHFREQSAKSTHVMAFILTLFAATIAVGVVYNNARIALSMRSRDFASLRVLGFTRGEIAEMLLFELGTQVALAIPLGWAVGYAMTDAMLRGADQEAYRLTPMVSAGTYAFATAVTLAAALMSALLVRRKLDKLDLIGVLKTRE